MPMRCRAKTAHSQRVRVRSVQKFPPFDEFTSFGKPCNNPDGKDSSRVRECMTLDMDPVQPLRKDLVKPPADLVLS